MKYNIGDKVRIKSIDWWNDNKDEYGYIDCGSRAFFTKMSDWCGKIATIKEICKTNCYRLEEYDFDWTDEMIECKVEKEITNVIDEDKKLIGWIKEPNRYRLVPDKDYEIKYDEKGFFYLEKKKKEYPKTYEECCKVLEIEGNSLLINTTHITNYERDLGNLMGQLHRLIICRDAYWKIAGEEMGLGKPWEPDYNKEDQPKYGLYEILKYSLINPSQFVFPTEEIRDAFKENFDKDIKICK